MTFILELYRRNDDNLDNLSTEYITDIRIVIGDPDRTPIQASRRRLNSNQLCRMHHPHASEPQVPHSLVPSELLLPELPTRPSASKTWNDALPVSSHHSHLISHLHSARLPIRLLHLGRSSSNPTLASLGQPDCVRSFQ
ncbi:hypothetical protein CaCOL14_003702 [Colletotrichum acutatum]